MTKTIFNSNDDIPSDLDYSYIVARDGFFLKKRTALFEALVKIKEIPELPEMKPSADLIGPRIPYSLIAEALKFFQVVYSKYQGEAMVFLLFEDGAWQIVPAKQEVCGANVSYENKLHLENKRPAGTIHSHCNMSASFSATDDSDDKFFDGIHITLGKIFDDMPDIAASLVVNGCRFEAKPEQIFLDMPNEKLIEHPWLKLVSVKNNHANLWHKSYFGGINALFKKDDKQGELFPGFSNMPEKIKTAISALDVMEKADLYKWLRDALTEIGEQDPTVFMYLEEVMQEGGDLWE